MAEFPRSHFSLSCQGRSVAVASMGLESGSVPGVSVPCWSSPGRHQANLACAPCCSLSHVGSAWPHDYGGNMVNARKQK